MNIDRGPAQTDPATRPTDSSTTVVIDELWPVVTDEHQVAFRQVLLAMRRPVPTSGGPAS